MRRNARIGLFALAAAGFLALFAWGLRGLPPAGHYRGPYGDAVNAASVPERHVTDAVTAVNFDFRGFDTLGEEFILFCSVMGVLLLLRKQPDEHKGPPRDQAPRRRVPGASDAVRLFCFALAGPLVLFGLYIVTHGQLTPGGGFQAGVILATAPLVIYLATEFKTLRGLAPRRLVEVAEATGAGGYALIGLAAWLYGAPFLANVLPLGKIGDVFSGGIVPLISLAVGLEVSAGFLLLLSTFLEETVVREGPS